MTNINIYLFGFVLLLFACESTTTSVEVAEKIPLTYLALGDSYTIGESVEVEERYPIQLAQKLRANSIDIDTPLIIAKTGWTTDELQAAINERNLQDTFDLVSLLIGVNNQFRGYPIEDYRKEFDELLSQAIDFSGGKKENVFVISIPDYGFTPFGQGRDAAAISLGIDQYNAINDSITQVYGISYFNITDISREGVEQPDLVASDQLHPSGTQYQRWVASFYEAIKKKVE